MSWTRPFAVALDGAGDIVAAGFTINTGTRDFTVIKFDGANGAELWRRAINSTANGFDQALAVAVDTAGDVVATGETNGDFTVVKFDGASGAELWRWRINGTANAVTLDAAGNVVAAGYTQNTGTLLDFTVVKLNGSDGSDF